MLGRSATIRSVESSTGETSRFWDAEPEPAERRKLILSLFEQVWQKDGKIVAVKPNHTFANYFTAASEGRPTHPKASESSEATKAGATGVKPSFVTPGSRSRFGSEHSVFRASDRRRRRREARRALAAHPASRCCSTSA
jgi:hypothetical protein